MTALGREAAGKTILDGLEADGAGSLTVALGEIEDDEEDLFACGSTLGEHRRHLQSIQSR